MKIMKWSEDWEEEQGTSKNTYLGPSKTAAMKYRCCLANA